MDLSSALTSFAQSAAAQSSAGNGAITVIKSIGAPPALRPASSPSFDASDRCTRSASSTPELRPRPPLELSSDVEMCSSLAYACSSFVVRLSVSLSLSLFTATSSASDESSTSDFASPCNGPRSHSMDNGRLRNTPTPSPSPFISSSENAVTTVTSVNSLSFSAAPVSVTPGLSRQQLLSGPCPVCGDRISGFHYGIFSCESCKGFFKRTVQNKKNYVCLRGANCPVSIGTRKKCPACRFEKCLKMGMKLEAIREDRTRGGRSTYQCSYTLSPPTVLGYGSMPTPSESNSSTNTLDHETNTFTADGSGCSGIIDYRNSGADESPIDFEMKQEPSYFSNANSNGLSSRTTPSPPKIPQLIQDILSVEYLWHKDRSNEKHHNHESSNHSSNACNSLDESLNNLCNIADNRLYKIVKWCKSLPLFKDISMDDQIALLINSWCELLLLSCCYRSMSTPETIRISSDRSVSVSEARQLGIGAVIERMVNLTNQLSKLQLDGCEFVCLKVISLLTSDASGLKEKEKVDICQKQVLEALQTYVRSNYPNHPSKFGEILLRIPELERVCQVAKESLATKHREGDVNSLNLLMELLRGDH
ncbi:nuclear hormone receptor FTZ-F1 beta-like protein [Dinothrombium tinctorium]|uniref:Nuclear hormone receptor FTZ-F1 beta-like protein n=1 Tax=Dinothrombium tinctorium TaxID=1965070 RepID=A0A443QS37_9ACAR|nr:nuclear hormone receptor FTZ-F1 beta-like protein [Dinothrombium tinctorium]